MERRAVDFENFAEGVSSAWRGLVAALSSSTGSSSADEKLCDAPAKGPKSVELPRDEQEMRLAQLLSLVAGEGESGSAGVAVSVEEARVALMARGWDVAAAAELLSLRNVEVCGHMGLLAVTGCTSLLSRSGGLVRAVPSTLLRAAIVRAYAQRKLYSLFP